MSGRRAARASIHVLAGTNGAGKSSVAGALIRVRGGEYFNPDEATLRILQANPAIGLDRANSEAWLQGRRLLERATDENRNFTFETTLGGRTITALLEQAHDRGLVLRIWYVGLEGADLHVARVRARAAAGGHDIPEARIRERYVRSRENLLRLLPHLSELVVYDNSAQADPVRGIPPRPLLILHTRDGALVQSCGLAEVPGWAKPIFMAVARHHLSQ